MYSWEEQARGHPGGKWDIILALSSPTLSWEYGLCPRHQTSDHADTPPPGLPHLLTLPRLFFQLAVFGHSLLHLSAKV